MESVASYASHKAYELRIDSQVGEDEPDEIRAVFAHWDQVRGSRDMPRRAELDIIGCTPTAAGNVFLVDVHAAAPRFVLRLVGTKVQTRLGLTKGDSIEALDAGCEMASIVEQYERTVADRRPTLCVHSWVRLNGKPIDYRRLLLPLGEYGQVETLLGCVVFGKWDKVRPKRRIL
ncbi:PAS domain-containing protein [Roseiterribacter gracilis]|uniref:PAS domain-containing protein n=1 Tax=Roseiterribacter gracilis TaxID=2812848 RepID=A0A8S8XF18_9PROT|nr:hypothetical protein TMPK1_20630 [Rhodospirillales bacterium TMPK1]